MSSWLGYRNVGDQSKLVFAVNTHSASTGAATDATGDPSYRVYEDETGTPILTGTMGKLDDANTTGFYSEELTISSGNGFEAGKTYTIYITATVGSIAGTTERHFACWPATINSQIDANVVQISGDSGAADNLESYTDGTTPMPVNAIQISGDATAADNLESAADGTGYNLGGGSIVAASVSGAVNSVTTGVTVATNNDKTGYSLATAPPTAADIADAVWDETLSGHLTSGSTGAALNAAGAAGDPWSTTLPGAYGAGTAGKIVGDNLNATVSSRLASADISLSGGAVTVGTLNSAVITSSSFASQAIVGTAIQDGAITANKIATGAITSGKFASGAITADAIAAGAISVSEIADGAITAAKFGAGAITASVLATDAVEEIADGVWEEPMAGHTTAGTYGGRIPRSDSSNVEIKLTGSKHIAADVHEFQPDVIDAAAIAPDAIDASAIASDALTEIAQAVLSEATSTNTGVYAAGDVGNVLGRLHSMIESDGLDFRYTANALEQAPSGGGGGGGNTVRMGPFEIRAEGQASDVPLDINKGATHGIDCFLVDAQGTGVDLAGATYQAKVYNTSGTLVATVNGSATYAAGGGMTWTIPTSVTNTAGTYTATITRTTGPTDTQVFGPLRIYVRDI